jgi:hypothetical protein
VRGIVKRGRTGKREKGGGAQKLQGRRGLDRGISGMCKVTT